MMEMINMNKSPRKTKEKEMQSLKNYQVLIPLFSAINVYQSLLQSSQAVPISSVVMASVQLQKPVEIPQSQAPALPLPAIQTHSKPSEQQASSIQTSQKYEDKHVGSNIVEGVKELLHIEPSSTKTEHVERPLTSAKEGAIGGIVAEKKKKDKKDKDKKEKDKKEKDKHAKNNEDGQGATICKSPKTHDKKEKKKNKNKDDNSSDDDAGSKAKKLDKEKKKHK